MKKIRIETLRREAEKKNVQPLFEKAMREGKIEGDFLWLTAVQIAAFNPEHPALKQPVQATVKITPLPRAKWPLWARSLALLAKPEDSGLGDVIERTVGPLGGEAFKVWYKLIFKKECGCNTRRDTWNLRWPLNFVDKIPAIL